MRRLLLTVLTALVWLLASPSLQWRDAGWVEVGVTPATAQSAPDVKGPAKSIKKKSAQKTRRTARIGSSGVVRSNQPGFYPMQPILVPQQPSVAGTVITPAID